MIGTADRVVAHVEVVRHGNGVLDVEVCFATGILSLLVCAAVDELL